MTSNRNGPESSLNRLNDYIICILAADSEQCDRDLLFLIKRRLLQYGLSELLTVEDILHESFIRAEQKIVQQRSAIENIPAWLNVVSLNVIREHSRSVRSDRRTYQKLKASLDIFSSLAASENYLERYASCLDQLPSVVNSLSVSEQAILELKFVKKESWRSVAEHLSRLESKPVSEAAARKRGERMLTKLKSLFSKDVIDR